MSRRRRGGGGHQVESAGAGAERWLLTYADMITLLLALFILLFAMSTIDVVRFDALRRTLAQSFRGQVLDSPGRVATGSQSVLDPSAPSQSPQRTAFQLQKEAQSVTGAAFQKEKDTLDRYVASQKLQSKVDVVSTQRGIVIRLAGDAFFQSGSAALNPRMEQVMRHIAADLRSGRRQLSIEGHTDGQPISTAQFPDNLVLSSARAITIYRFLQGESIDRHRMRVVGYADTKPVVDPDFAEQAVARNRRVEIVVMSSGSEVDDGAQAQADRVPGGNARLVAGPQQPIAPPSQPATIDVIGPIFRISELG